MSTAEIDLLAPIEGENPAGESLQYAPVYDEIREARREEDDLDQGDWKRQIKTADWRQVIALTTEALATRTKDLQIAAWLAEALVESRGLPGLVEGLDLMRAMHELYWDNVYPEIDEGDLEARANSLSFLDTRIALAAKKVPITSSSTGRAYSYRLYEASLRYDIPEDLDGYDGDQLRHFEEVRQEAEADGNITTEEWRLAKSATKRAFYEQLTSELDAAWQAYLALDRVMDEKFGRQTPGLGTIKKALDEIREIVAKILKEKRALEPSPADLDDVAEGDAEDGAVDGGASGPTGGAVRSRREALRRLVEVADYFRAAEPHSPISYLVQRAVRWGEMPLEAWLAEVVKDDAVLGGLRETLGMRASD